MLRWVLRRMVESVERKWNYDATYLKEIIDISPRAAWLFARTSSLGNYRRDVSLAACSPPGSPRLAPRTAAPARNSPRRWPNGGGIP